MKINQVERLAGISKVNIRFYEKEGLLTPGRNSENGYREYTESDVDWLKKIRLLRMLDVPIEEILKLRSGELTLSEAMNRHMIQLERRRTNLAVMEDLCAELKNSRCSLAELDADETLERMERKEREGTKFMKVKKQDKPTRYVAPVVAAIVMVLLMVGLVALFVWAFTVSPEDAPPLAVVLVLIAVPLAVIVGVLLAMVQRLKQIKGGEEDAASQY